jgi:hypothetical protein
VVAHQVTEASTDRGQRCAYCKRAFQLGEMVEDRPVPPTSGRSGLRPRQILHRACVPVADGQAPRA